MGSSRYESSGRQLGKRIDDVVTRPQPITLTAQELDLEHHPVRTGERTIRVQAWVRFPEAVIRAEAEAFEWTDRAVHIRWTAGDGATRQAWASSVDRLQP